MSEKGQNGRCFASNKLENNNFKGKRTRESEVDERKINDCTLSFLLGTLEIFFGRKQLLETRGVFGDNVFINPAGYILIDREIKSNKS